ncbi:coiled-coil domain-containing protein 83 [Chiroxiphia lanceolata]|uniref:coiled-coil domain-containing protein 83 n=1 Tax=Chiroxiphia lanceolata TaxID=296741 RepID=UPI0013CE5160|nr:coiled-coil domain-containing protein 83 [Chiroxiphia lanceolata]XP_032534170.1 coiled-coil domain-containing protein 83 [Chiroxiphia lanceolata]XP_032534172.1 coiled-coil domain-containing protein 83 [Chiroxiphia lanceolata]
MEENKKEEKPGKQVTEPESDIPEAVLELQIETKEATIDRVLVHLEELENKIKEYHKRNDVLKEEQQALIRRLIKQIEEKEKERDDKEVVTRDDVEESLKAIFQYVRDKEQLFKELRSQIEEIQQRISVKQRERDYWLEYKNVGSKIHADKISSLEKDIKKVKDELQRTTEYYRDALNAVKEEHKSLFDRHLKLLSEQALKSAVGYLDKNCRREIQENEWLKEEVKIYRKEVSDLKASVQLLEEENTSLVAKLIDIKLQNQIGSRHLFLSEAAGLQEGFPKDEMEVEYREYAAKADGEESLRSATVPCQRKKAFPKVQSKTEDGTQDSEELRKKFFTTALDRLLYEDEDDFQAYLKLGPLKRKLYVVGRAVPTHHKEQEEMPSRSDREDGSIGKSDGHITAEMIRALFKENVDCN